MKRDFRKRLSIDIPTYFYDELKAMAKKRNVTMTRIVIELLFLRIAEEKKYQGNKN